MGQEGQRGGIPSKATSHRLPCAAARTLLSEPLASLLFIIACRLAPFYGVLAILSLPTLGLPAKATQGFPPSGGLS